MFGSDRGFKRKEKIVTDKENAAEETREKREKEKHEWPLAMRFKSLIAREKEQFCWAHQEFKRAWRENDVPKCPSCRGSGEGRNSSAGPTRVYWKGKLTVVCSQCEGSGRS